MSRHLFKSPSLVPLFSSALAFACVEMPEDEVFRGDLEDGLEQLELDELPELEVNELTDDDEQAARRRAPLLVPSSPEADAEALAVYEALAAKHGVQLDPTTVAGEAAARLEQASPGLHLRTRDGRVVQAFGRPIASVTLDDARDPSEAELAARTFMRDYAGLFGLAAEQLTRDNLTVARVRDSGALRIDFRQHFDGLPIIDGDFAIGFDGRGRMTRIVGAPWGRANIPSSLEPAEPLADAAALALKLAARERPELDARQTEVEPSLAIRGADGRLVWQVRLRPLAPMGLDAHALLDAHTGELLELEDEISHGTQYVDVRHYNHNGGEDNGSGLSTGSINTNTFLEVPLPGVGNMCIYGLQRLGQGRARMWNAKNVSSTGTPSFPPVISGLYPCGTAIADFTESNVPASDPDWQFNAQTAYWWAQFLKTRVDNWGRYANSYGHYPIDDVSRRVNVEIVVNANGNSEGYWCGGDVRNPGDPSSSTVMHGCFRSSIDSGWFSNHPNGANDDVPTVFLYNHSANSGSPQYHGAEVSPDHSITIHEVGHYISWTYGSWRGSGSNMGSSLNEGMSMVLPELFAKDYWGSSVAYGESEDVQTGGRWNSDQWTHHVFGDPATEVYSSFSCTIDRYKRAWPFVQAMWHLTQNDDEDNAAIWTSDANAVDNAADLIMWAMYNDTDNSSMTWDSLVWDLVYYQIDRHAAGTEKSAQSSYGSFWATYAVWLEHGLLSPCT